MIKKLIKRGKLIILMVIALFICAIDAEAVIDGLTGTTFNLTAKAGIISTADGNSVLIWGYANGAGTAQFPGPTLIVNQGATITVNLTNQLRVPVSIVFPGQTVTTVGGNPVYWPMRRYRQTIQALPRTRHGDLHLHRNQPGNLYLLQWHQA